MKRELLAARRWLLAVSLPDLLLAAACTLFALLIVTARYLPLIDLPQHASQIASWLRLSDARYPDGSLFALNYTTPYWVAYSIARALAPVLGVVAALRVTVALAMIATAWSVRGLARDLGHSPWLGLLALPCAVGYSFYFGFISFLMGTALAISCWRVALAYARRPTRSGAVLLAALLLLTFTCHAFGLTIALAGTLPLLCEGASLHQWPRRLAPVLPAALFVLWWLPELNRFGQSGGEYWGLGLQRVFEIPGRLVGLGKGDPVGLMLGVALLATCGWLAWGPPQVSLLRWIPVLGLGLGYLALPLQLRSVGFVYPRLVAVLIPALLLALRPTPRPSVALWGPRLASAIAGGWLALFGTRLALFQEECRDFDAIVADMPHGLAVRPIVFGRESSAFPGVDAFLHFPAYYHVEKGGTQGFSFARYPISVVRERVPQPHVMGDGAEWLPSEFGAERELPVFDYFLVRSDRDRSRELFGSQVEQVSLVNHHGQWWGYQKRAAVATR